MSYYYLSRQTSGGGPYIDKNTGKHTRPLNNPNTVLEINKRKYNLQLNIKTLNIIYSQ